MKEAISAWIPTMSRQGAAFASLLGLRGSGAGALASGTLASRAFASGAGDMDRSPGAFLGSWGGWDGMGVFVVIGPCFKRFLGIFDTSNFEHDLNKYCVSTSRLGWLKKVADPDTQLFSHASQLYVYPWPLVHWKCCSYQAISRQAFLAITSGSSCNPLGGWSLKSWIVGGILGLQHIVTSSL